MIRGLVSWVGLIVLFGFVFASARGLTPLILLLAAVILAGTFWLGMRRARWVFARMQHHLGAGQPEPLLALVDRALRHRKTPSTRGPLLVFRAAGLSMRGDWDEAERVLDEVDPEAMPEPGKEVWQFGYWGARFGCAIFTERIEAARHILQRRIEPLSSSERLRGAGHAIEAARAELWFCEGEHERARPVFERLVDQEGVPAASRAVFHYFLGRIAADAGEVDDAERHFARAEALAPETWLPAGIQALR